MESRTEYPADSAVVSNGCGVLWVVATPIGNLRDLTFRGRDVLAAVEWVAAEDTRRSRQLLDHFNLSARLLSLHEHNEAARVPRLLRMLAGGRSLALVSDAGTPLLSDPGARLVAAAHEAGVRVVPVPGASSIAAALSAAGFSAERFLFAGFLPARRSARRAQLAPLINETRTAVLFEAPHRIVACLHDLVDLCGRSRKVVLARELTKVHETLVRGPLGDVLERVEADKNQRRGEMVLVLSGAAPSVSGDLDPDVDDVLRPLLAELPVKQAVRLAARITGVRRNSIYQRALALADEYSDEY